MSGYAMTLKNGDIYWLDESGTVEARSDGPKDWEYSGRWIILGFSKRIHSHSWIKLGAAADGANIGQGWVHDLDHGTHRLWASPTGRRVQSIRRV